MLAVSSVEWSGDPIFYPRDGGSYGLIIGRYQYIFDKVGSLSSVSKVTEPLLQAIVKQLYPDNLSAALTHIKKVKD